MSRRRLINTKFWSDSFVVELPPLFRYLFLYLLTNDHTELCGVYELSLSVIKRETGLDDGTIAKAFEALKGKIYYIDSWVFVKNFEKNQSLNENMKKASIRTMALVPEKIKAKITELDEPFRTLPNPSEPLPNPSENLNLNLNLNLNSKERAKVFAPPCLEEVTLYCKERGNNIDPEGFIDFYTSKGWMIGKNKIKDWKACIRTWEKRNLENQPNKQTNLELDEFIKKLNTK